MKIEFDKEADAAYIYLKDEVKSGEAKKQICVSDEIIIDLDSDDKILGIEILNAKKNLSKIPQNLKI